MVYDQAGRYYLDTNRNKFVCFKCNLPLESYCAPDEPACQCYDEPAQLRDMIGPKAVIALKVVLIIAAIVGILMVTACAMPYEFPKPLTKKEIEHVVADIGQPRAR